MTRRNADDAALRRRARAAGFRDTFTDGLGQRRRTSTDALRRLLRAVEDTPAASAPLALATAGGRRIFLPWRDDASPPRGAALTLEDGAELPLLRGHSGARAGVVLTARTPIPLGVHRLSYRSNGRTLSRLLLAPPATLRRETERHRGDIVVFLPLHAARTSTGLGVGTYSDLGRLVRWADQTAGALVGTLPLFPTFLEKPFDPSPYAPVSRLFWNELYIDPSAADEFRAPEVQRLVESAAFRRDASRARRGDLVDYALSWRLMRSLLSTMSDAASCSSSRWTDISTAAGAEAPSYAAFRAAVERTGSPWQSWPGTHPGGIAGQLIDPRAERMYLYAQALASEQVRDLARLGPASSPLYLDLPVGVHSGGYDTWRRPELFLNGLSAGAPPDALYDRGQSWGFPPMHPATQRLDGYAYFRAVLRRMLSAAGLLRIDHVMGLHRMYCVPEGFDARDGAYLAYPARELYAVLMIEAARAGAGVVGEDLGNVPPVTRRTMRAHGLLGMHVQQFALGGPPGHAIGEPGPNSLASLNTHDTPTFAGFWTARDVALRQELGLIDDRAARSERAGRAAMRRAVTADLVRRRLPSRGPVPVARSLMRIHAAGPAAVRLVNLEDLLGQTEPQNIPGTCEGVPNWRRRSPKPLAAILRSRPIAAALEELVRRRSHSAGERRHNR